MKYFKYSIGIMAITIIMSSYNVNASLVRNIVNIKIPVFQKAATVSAEYKSTSSSQYIKKTKCTDDLTGDGRVIIAAINYVGDNDSGAVEARPNVKVAIPNSNRIGTVSLYLQSNKSLPTTATFSGTWTVDN